MTRQKNWRREYILATHSIEKLFPSEEALHLCEQLEKGTVNADTAVSAVLKRYGLVGVRGNG